MRKEIKPESYYKNRDRKIALKADEVRVRYSEELRPLIKHTNIMVRFSCGKFNLYIEREWIAMFKMSEKGYTCLKKAVLEFVKCLK